MHARQLVQLAGWAAAHAQELIQCDSALPESALQQYWAASRCRIQRWIEVLRQPLAPVVDASRSFAATDTPTNDIEQSANVWGTWKAIRIHWRLIASLEEILLSELLSRVWAALLTAYDQHHGSQQASPPAQSIFQGHLEVRSRLLNLLLQLDEHLVPEAVCLNQLRSQVERWTDLLLATLADLVPPTPFAFDTCRVQDFAADFSPQACPATHQQAWNLTLLGLRKAFETPLQPISPNPDLNQAIAQAVLDCLPPEGSLWTLGEESVWYLQMDHYTRKLEDLLKKLLTPPEEE